MQFVWAAKFCSSVVGKPRSPTVIHPGWQPVAEVPSTTTPLLASVGGVVGRLGASFSLFPNFSSGNYRETGVSRKKT
jgi:hypothetical protein